MSIRRAFFTLVLERSERTDREGWTASLEGEAAPALVAEGTSEEEATRHLLEMLEALRERRGWEVLVVARSGEVGSWTWRRQWGMDEPLVYVDAGDASGTDTPQSGVSWESKRG